MGWVGWRGRFVLATGDRVGREQQQVVCYRVEDEHGGGRSAVSLPASLVGVACGFPRNSCWSWGLI